jgi:hypothetical protein
MVNPLAFVNQADLFNGWLKFKELGKLDASFGKNDRKLFHDLISSNSCSNLVKSNDGFVSQCAINWISARRVRIVHCFVGTDCKLLSPENYLEVDVLEVLCDRNTDKQWLMEIINQWFTDAKSYMRVLRKKIVIVGNFVSLDVLLSELDHEKLAATKQCRRIEFYNNRETFHQITLKQSEDFNGFMQVWIFCNDSFVEFTAVFKQIFHNEVGDTLKTIAERYPEMTEFYLMSSTQFVDMVHIINLFTWCPQLTKIQLSGDIVVINICPFVTPPRTYVTDMLTLNGASYEGKSEKVVVYCKE